MMLSLEHHPLARDFPYFKELIHRLKQHDHHFAALLADYEAVDKAVLRIETDVEPRSDAVTEDLKKRRAQLKDRLYACLQEAAASA
ncbi:DUF465 domain-containing protein [Neisseriaceae bacterium JH1-16]|nr:DUF465 domain-containing protein [Neisseriaceae bacterium JH1-16]